MKKHTQTLDIHGLIGVTVNTNRLGRLKSIDCPLSYFEGNPRASTTISVDVGNFCPDLAGTTGIDHKYYVKDDYVFCRENMGRASWQMEISGLEGDEISVRFHSRLRGLPELLIPNYLAYNVAINPLVELLLLRKGYSRIHGVAVDQEGQALPMVTRGGAHKTRIAMQALRSKGRLRLLGDDRVILGPNRRALSYPIFSDLVLFRSLYLANEDVSSALDRIRFYRFSQGFSWNNLDRTTLICDESHFRTICVGARKKGLSHPVATEIEAGALVAAVHSSNCLEMINGGIASLPFINFLYVLQAYSYAMPDSKVSRHWLSQERILQDLLRGVKTVRVDLPQEYSSRLLDWLMDISLE